MTSIVMILTNDNDKGYVMLDWGTFLQSTTFGVHFGLAGPIATRWLHHNMKALQNGRTLQVGAPKPSAQTANIAAGSGKALHVQYHNHQIIHAYTYICTYQNMCIYIYI